MSAPLQVDWSKVEPHFRAGIRPLRSIAEEFGVTHAAIRKHAGKAGWERDLKARVNAKADAKVSAAMVSAEVSKEALVTENLRVEVEAEIQARIRLSHRKDIAKFRDHALALQGELEILEDTLPIKVRALKDLTDITKTLIGLEREAFGLADMAQLPKAQEVVDPLDVARRLAFVFAEARTLQ